MTVDIVRYLAGRVQLQILSTACQTGIFISFKVLCRGTNWRDNGQQREQ